MLCSLFLAGPACFAQSEMLFDFETGTANWAAHWGLDAPPKIVSKYAITGKQCLEVVHTFDEKQETAAARVCFDPPLDLDNHPNVIGIEAWLYIPHRNHWQAQLYIQSGPDWQSVWGALTPELSPGRHKLYIKTDRVQDPSFVRSIGIQFKNYKIKDTCRIYIDSVRFVTEKSEQAE
jgi:hypothetical protein